MSGLKEDGDIRKEKLERLMIFLTILDKGQTCIVNSDMYTMNEYGEFKFHDFHYKNGDPASSPSISVLMSNLVELSVPEFNSMGFDDALKVAIKDEDGGCVLGRTHHFLPGAYKWYKNNISTLITLGQFLRFVRKMRFVMAQNGRVYSLHLEKVISLEPVPPSMGPQSRIDQS